jgi:hypothetical protein
MFYVRYIVRNKINLETGAVRSAKTYARLMERAFNEIEKNNRKLVRVEKMEDGHMIVSMDAPPVPEFLAQILKPQPHPIPEDVLTKEAQAFMDAVFAGIDAPGNKKVALEKLPEVLPTVCRRYSNTDLRAIFGSIKEYIEHHDHHDHQGESCDMTLVMKELVQAGEEWIRKSTC